MKKLLFLILSTMSITASAQQIMSPEILWKLGRVTPLGISKDEKSIVYKVATPSVEENKINSKFYTIPRNGGAPTEIKETKSLLNAFSIVPASKALFFVLPKIPALNSD